MFSRGLKCLDLDQVVDLAVKEVPKIFQAEWCVLCFPQDGCPAELVRRESCPCPHPDLLSRPDAREVCRTSRVVCGEPPAVCQKLGGEAPDVLLPLTVDAFPGHDPSGEKERRGYLCLCRMAQGQRTSQDLLKYKGRLIGDVVSAHLTNANLYQQARRDSQVDPLTGANTRRVLEERLEAEYERAVRYGHGFCLALLDVDHFKHVNDRSGHVAGDRALLDVTGTLRTQMRATDLLARYGGDEFVVLMPETHLEDAHAAVERMRQQVESGSESDGHPHVTISCGLAEWSGLAEERGTDVLRRADAALYEAKRMGRNCVKVSQAA
jgi:diguanylate cyclase (GGDEF)-like protein